MVDIIITSHGIKKYLTFSHLVMVGALVFFVFSLNRFDAVAQVPPNTEVFMADIRIANGNFEVLQVKNVSENEGYDSQPSFSPDGQSLLYASNRGGETDIMMASVWSLNKIWLTDTPNRSEYSPQLRPGHQQVSYVTLTPDGVQDFRVQELPGSVSTRKEQIIEAEEIIGYYTWINESDYLCFVLPTSESPTTLQWHKGFGMGMGDVTKQVMQSNPGRSFHQVPDSDLISFIDKTTEPWQINLWNPASGDREVYAPTLEGSEDMAWLPDGQAIMASGSIIYFWNSTQWQPLMDLSSAGVTNITRLAVNKKGEKLAFVGELSAHDANN